MRRNIKGRTGRLRAQLAALVLTAAGLTVVGATQAQAYSPEACVFFAPSGAPLLPGGWFPQGHVGWGFKTGANSYTWGATEGPSNQSWHKSGTRAKMIASFRNGGALNKKYYKYYKCVTAGGDAASAEAARKYLQARPFGVGDDCLDQTADILGTNFSRSTGPQNAPLRRGKGYGVNLPSPKLVWKPVDWYGLLGPWPYTGWKEAKL